MVTDGQVASKKSGQACREAGMVAHKEDPPPREKSKLAVLRPAAGPEEPRVVEGT